MKTKKLIYILPLVLLIYTGCKKYDNYDSPTSGIKGRLIDAETNTSLELEQPGGGVVRMVEWNKAKYPNPSPIDIQVRADGSYSSTQFFADNYKAFPYNGPYQYLPADSVDVVLKSNAIAELDFKVVPFFRISLSVTDSTFTYTVTKSAANTGNSINTVLLLVNNYEIVNKSVSANQAGNYFQNQWKIDVNPAILGIPQTVTVKWADTHLPKGDYYFRVAASGDGSAGYFNYSPVVKATVH